MSFVVLLLDEHLGFYNVNKINRLGCS